MKTFYFYLLLGFVFFFVSLDTFAGIQATYYISPKGNDNNPGTLELPFATLQKARDMVRTIKGNMNGDIIIDLLGGMYELTSPFVLSSDDSGMNGYNIIYQAYNCETPVISGGIKISGWTLHDAGKNIYMAKVSTSIDTRQLYVNGIRAIRARSEDAGGWKEDSVGYICPNGVDSWKNIKNVEVVSRKDWTIKRGPIAKVNGTQVIMAEPYWMGLKNKFQAPPVWIENAYELLNKEGEWYLDRSTGVLYYKPRLGEDMKDAEVILPVLETLVQGSNVSNVQFKGITFSYATWLLPNSVNGYPRGQAGVLNSIQTPGNVKFDHSFNLRFENNSFCHLGATGLDLNLGCKKNVISNNTYNDISGSAISIGNVISSHPTESDLVCDNTINNNYIRKAAQEYECCVGIFVGYSEHTIITHNEVRNLPYTGISVGWGWGNRIVAGKNNEISYNLVDSVMMILQDGGGIYTLSSQPGARIFNNYLNYQVNTSGSLYPDQGSSNMNWNHNVVSNTIRWLHLWNPSIQNDTIENNFYDNKSQLMNGTNCVVQNNVFVSDNKWPAEARTIMKNAGRVEIPINEILLSTNTMTLNVGDTTQLNYTISPCNATNKEVSWKCNNDRLAIVSSNGLVTAKAKGFVKIYLITNDGLHKMVCKIKMK
jgi:hypothetical protein